MTPSDPNFTSKQYERTETLPDLNSQILRTESLIKSIAEIYLPQSNSEVELATQAISDCLLSLKRDEKPSEIETTTFMVGASCKLMEIDLTP